MPVNVSEIAVRVTGDTVNLQLQMQKASQAIQQVGTGAQQTVNRVNGSMKAAQGIAQNAVFAIDDFVTSFETGGIAGGLRGAGNNLTFIASQMGRIEGGLKGVIPALIDMKGQLALIGAIASIQILVSQFQKLEKEALDRILDKLKAIEDARDKALGQRVGEIRFDEQFRKLSQEGDAGGITSAIEALNVQLREADAKTQSLKDSIREVAEFRATLLGDTRGGARGRGQGVRVTGEQLEEIDKKLIKFNEDLRTSTEEFGQLITKIEALRQLAQELDKIGNATKSIKNAIEFGPQINQQDLKERQAAQQGLDQLDKRLNDILDPEGKAARMVADQIEDVNKAFNEGLINEDDALKRIDRIRDAAISELAGIGEGSLFTGQLPSAARAGSSEAVGAINRAIGVTMNTSFEQKTALNTQKSAEALKRIEAEIKKGQAVIVGVK